MTSLLTRALNERQYRLRGKSQFSLIFTISHRHSPPSTGAMAQWHYQNFVGLDLYFPDGHGLEKPRLMDARVDQLNAFRFIYSLPWDKQTESWWKTRDMKTIHLARA